MIFARVVEEGIERISIIDKNKNFKDISKYLKDLNPETINFDILDKLKKINLKDLPGIPNPKILSPINRVIDFLAVGLNYKAHAEGTNSEVKKEPIIFNKSAGCIIGPYDDVKKPKNSFKLDHEIEVAMVIGKKGKYIKNEEALDYIFGFCICNDFSERDWQKNRNGQWIKGKSIAGSLGPYLVTKDEIEDIYDLNLSLCLNGFERQKGNTRELIFNFEYLVSYISQFFTLYPGTIITTGTPSGTIMEDKDPKFLKSGDVLKLKIDYLGEQTQKIVNE